MELFLNEVQDERNVLHEKLQVAEAQLVGMSKLVRPSAPAGVPPEEVEKLVGPLNRQIADLVSRLVNFSNLKHQNKNLYRLRRCKSKLATRRSRARRRR